ncbi:sigma-70 family RNA polymerase sigma factor [Bacillus sp. BP-3]|uniref:sigma-70 family RNA polymerase sigma factor n=1 Tax=Bacillus sp. BP-3 TaxID=3022773 RepID=UPI00232A7B5F|nr:sigma-70 family RNA polymerase sigma factor [Bacillus sp. BP-3]MDC2863996.1 sigma-70 family RNA polymerase sigma factor [Bacillus sp. BP-3]
MATTSIAEHQKTKADRVRRLYSLRKRMQILEVEELWESYAMQRLEEGENAFDIVLNNPGIKRILQRNLYQLDNGWKKKRIPREDFESILLEKLWTVFRDYSWAEDLFVYEHITKALKDAAYDLIKLNLKTDKRKANYNDVEVVCTFDSYKSSSCVGDVDTKLLIQQYCNDQEQRLLIAYLDNPGIPYAELGRMYGINHHTKVKRTIDSALHKLKQAVA